MPNSYECAFFSQLCYQEAPHEIIKELNSLGRSWRLLGVSSPTSALGIKCLAICNSTTKELVIAIRGSHVVENFIVDAIGLNIGLTFLQSLSWEACYEEVQRFAEEYRIRHEGYTITSTGHSLGGFLAEMYACDLHSRGMSVQAISFESLGCKAHAKKKFVGLNTKTVPILAYLSAPNIINTYHDHIGEMKRVYVLHTEAHGKNTNGRHVALLSGTLSAVLTAVTVNPIYLLGIPVQWVCHAMAYLKHTHSMSNMLASFDPDLAEPVLYQDVISWPTRGNYLWSCISPRSIIYFITDPISEWVYKPIEVNQLKEPRIEKIPNYEVKDTFIIPASYLDLNSETKERMRSRILTEYDTFLTNQRRRQELYIALGGDPDTYSNPEEYSSLLDACEKGVAVDVKFRTLLANAKERNSVRNYTHYQGLTPLHLAARNGHAHLIEPLITAGISTEVADNYDGTPLLCAIYDGYSGRFNTLTPARARLAKETILELLKWGAKVEPPSGNWFDSGWKWLGIIGSLGIEEGVAPRRGDHRCWFAIHLVAFYTDDVELLKAIIFKGAANILAKTQSGYSARQLAAEGKNKQIEAYLDAFEKIRLASPQKIHCSTEARHVFHPKLIRYIPAKGEEPPRSVHLAGDFNKWLNAKDGVIDNNDRWALKEYMGEWYLEIPEELIGKECKFVVNTNKWVPEHSSNLRITISSPASHILPERDKEGYTPLLAQMKKQRTMDACRLIEEGADPSFSRNQQGDWYAYNAVHMATYLGDLAVIHALWRASHPQLDTAIDAYIERHNGDNPGFTPLLMALKYANSSERIEGGKRIYETIAVELASHGADPSLFRNRGSDWYGYNAVHMAAYTGNLPVLQALWKTKHLRLNAAINARIERHDGENPRFTPLLMAIRYSYTSEKVVNGVGQYQAIAIGLAEHGADPSLYPDRADNWYGYNAIHMAVYAGKLDIIKSIIKAAHPNLATAINARINREGGENASLTPLLMALKYGYTDIAIELLRSGAESGIKATHGNWKNYTAKGIADYKKCEGVISVMGFFSQSKKASSSIMPPASEVSVTMGMP